MCRLWQPTRLDCQRFGILQYLVYGQPILLGLLSMYIHILKADMWLPNVIQFRLFFLDWASSFWFVWHSTTELDSSRPVAPSRFFIFKSEWWPSTAHGQLRGLPKQNNQQPTICQQRFWFRFDVKDTLTGCAIVNVTPPVLVRWQWAWV